MPIQLSGLQQVYLSIRPMLYALKLLIDNCMTHAAAEAKVGHSGHLKLSVF